MKCGIVVILIGHLALSVFTGRFSPGNGCVSRGIRVRGCAETLNKALVVSPDHRCTRVSVSLFVSVTYFIKCIFYPLILLPS